MTIFFLLLNISFALFIFFLTLAFITGAPFVRSNKKAVNAMIRLAKIKPGMRVYDLGSGDGTLLLRAAQKGATAIGFEINPFLVLLSRLRRLRVYWKNFWHADLSKADVIFVYLLPWRMKSLEKLLLTKCKPGTLVVSNSFIFPSLKYLETDKEAHIYSFRV
ncbi:MAG: hypothetical protein AAB481_03225 [Patescibacteria group bacterium]